MLKLIRRPASRSAIVFVALIAFACAAPPKPRDSCREVRGALDIGSGSSKTRVSLVNVCEKKIEAKLASEDERVSYAADMTAHGGNFSAQVETEGLAALRTLRQKSEARPEVRSALQNLGQPAVIWSGFATSAFRQAVNGRDVAARFSKAVNIPIEVIAHEREAALGYASGTLGVAAEMKHGNVPTVVWDIGGGSQQIVFRDKDGQLQLKLIEGKASNGFIDHLIRTVLKKDPTIVRTPNPIGKKNMALARGALKTFLPEPITIPSEAQVVGIGGVFQIAVPEATGNPKSVTVPELDHALEKRVTMDDAAFASKYASSMASNLFLVRGMMEKLRVKRVEISPYQIADAWILEAATPK